jgi:ABC-type branched-subunit amino acid transport system ATPase component/branched-subunit amino acid ABC-type transport system permease component
VLPYIFAGLTTGSIFALAGVGLVLTYKTSGIFNFAHGALATASAFLYYFLTVQLGWHWPIAAAVCIIVAGPLMGLGLERIARPLAARSLRMQVLGTVGVLLLVQGVVSTIYSPGIPRSVPQFLPGSTVSVLGTPVAWYRIITFVIVLGAVAALTVFLRIARSGVAMRAVVDDPDLLAISGTSPVKTRRVAWVIGTCAVAASGVLLAPLLQLDVTVFTLLIVTAFGAAAIGAFTSLPATYAGGLAIGIGQALLQMSFPSSVGITGGLAESLPFLVLVALLIAAPRLRRPSLSSVIRPHGVSWRPPPGARLGGSVCLAVALLAVPAFAGVYLNTWTEFLAYTMVFLSLGLLVRMSGQVSLGHITFMAIGVVTTSHLAVDHHWPWLAAVLAAGVIAAPIGALLAIPAIRFPGLYLALATLGFGILVQYMLYGENFMFGQLTAGLTVPRPALSWLTSDRGYYYLVLIIAACSAALVLAIDRSRLGRLLRALADSPVGLAACGAEINVTRVLVFSLSAALAAVAGSLDGAAVGFVGSGVYAPIASLQLFVLVMIAVGDLPWYAVIAAIGQVLAPAYITTSATVSYILMALFGLSAVQYAITGGPPPVPRQMRAWIDRLAAALPRVRRRRPSPVHTREAEHQQPLPADKALEVRDVTVRYAGLVAADAVTLSARTGSITGLIGPNGAGKSTIFNACAGTVRHASGSVTLGGHRLDRLTPAGRARSGLGRTFQRVELFDSLTVAENVALGWEAHYAGWNPLGHVVATPAQSAAAAARTDAILRLCRIEELHSATAGSLSTGQRRLVELARCLAGPFDMLLLDEPSSGLDRFETEQFADILAQVVADRGVGILLVEHDMALINRLCDYVHVLDFGKQIFAGSVTEVRESPLVRAAYLGEEELAEELDELNDGNRGRVSRL